MEGPAEVAIGLPAGAPATRRAAESASKLIHTTVARKLGFLSV